MHDEQRKAVEAIFTEHPEIRSDFKQRIRSSAAVTHAAKSHTQDREAQALARQIATKSWAEDPTETLAGLIAYINEKLVDAGFRAYDADTVRRWIKDLAPPERRRPGRPPKK